MTWSDWLNGLKFGTKAPRRSHLRRKKSSGILSRQSRQVALSSENLEDRALLAATISLLAGTVTYAGDGNANDLTISVSGDTYTFTSAADTITVSSDDTGTNTGSGSKIVTIGGAGFPNHVTNIQIDLGDNTDSLLLTSIADPVTVSGGNGTDTITSGNTGSIFSLGSTLVVNTSSQNVTFSGFETATGGTGIDQFSVTANVSLNLVGGVGNDTFSIASGKLLTGSIDGTSGNDTLTLATPNAAVTLNGSDANGVAAGTVTGVSGGFSHIDTLSATGGGTEVLTGNTATNTWDVDAGTVNDGTATLLYSGFDSLAGGGGNDTFGLSANATANISGGLGNDSLNIAAGVALTGSFDATSGSDSITVATDATLATLTAGGANGFSGTITGVTGTFANVDSITTTGTTTESIVGPNATTSWDVDANTVTSGGATLTHTGFDSLFGGTGDDAFDLSANATKSIDAGTGNNSFTITGGTLTGSFTGSTGSDMLSIQTATAVVLSQSNSTGFGGTATGISGTFVGVNTLTVNAATANSLTGRNADSVWDVDAGTVSVSVNTLTFTNFGATDTLFGGTASDTFAVSANSGPAATTLTIDAGAGDDIFDLDATFGGSLNGGVAGTDTLDIAGAATGATIGVLSANGAAVTTTSVTSGATNIDTIAGGAAATLTGGTAGTPTWTVGATLSYSDGTNSVSFSGFAALQGGTAADIFNLTGPTAYNLNGGDGADNFVFATSGSTTGTINGGNQTDTLDYSALSTSVSVNFATGAATSVFNGAAAGVSNVENATGSATADTLVGDANANSLLGSGGDDTITGNAGADTLTGGADTDTLVEAISGAATLTPTTLVTGSTDTIATFETVTLNGGAGTNEALTIDLAAGSSLSFVTNFNGGAGGNDSLVLQNGTVTSSVYNFTNSTDGSVVLGAVGTTTINYTGLDPITSTLATTTATLNYSTAAETITIGANGGQIEVLSTAGETVTFNAPSGALTVNAGDTGDDSVILNTMGANPGSLVVNGGSGNDSFAVNAITVATTIDGGGGTNSVTTDATGRTYTATGINAGTIAYGSTVTIANIQNLTGGAGADTYDFTNGVMQGSIDGAGGSDTLIGNAAYNNLFTLTGAGSGTASVLTGTFSNIENITGAGNSDSLVIDGGSITGSFNGAGGSDNITADKNVATAFTVTGANSGTATGTGGFTNVENLTGNDAADTFTLNGGTLSGTITGGGGNDTFTGNNAATTYTLIGTNIGRAALTAGGAQVALWSGIENLTGGTANDYFLYTDSVGELLSGNIDGGVGTDTIEGDAAVNAWNITGANTGTVTRLGGTFSNIEGLVGGVDADTFTFTAAASAVSTISGGSAGNDTIVFAPGVDVTVNVTSLDGGTANAGVATFSNIDNLTGNTGNDVFTIAAAGSLSGSLNGGTGNDILTRQSAAATAIAWNILSAGGGTVTGVSGTFSGIESVAGTDGNDTFSFGPSGSLAGSLAGGNGTIDALNYSALSSAVTVSLAGGTASGVTGGISGIENLTGGLGDDSLTGDANVNTINGNDGNDTITGNAGSDALDGGFGSDRLQETIAAASATLSASSYVNGADTDTQTGFESASLVGGAGAETLTLAFGTDTKLGSIGAIAFAASTGTDVLNFTGTGIFGSATYTHVNSTDGTIALGDNTAINFFGLESGNTGVSIHNVTMNFTTTGETIVVAGAATQNSITSTQAADFTINNPLTSFVINAGDTGADTVTLNGYGTGFGAATTINAGTGDDVLNVNAVPTAATGTLALNGDGGTDTLNVNVATLSVTISGTNSGSLTGGAAVTTFSSIENLTNASATGTTYTINAPTAIAITGGTGNDTLQGTLIDDVTLTATAANGYTGTEASIGGGFSNIDTIISTGAAGTLTSNLNASAVWSIDATSTIVSGGQTLTFSGFTTLTGDDGVDDSLTVNFASANVIPNGLAFNGGTGANDLLALQNVSTQFAAQTFNYTNATDGSVVFTTAAAANTTLTYTGLDPITSTGTPLNVTFNLTGGADNVTLDDTGASFVLAGGTIETTTVAYPGAGGSLTFNLGLGADTFEIQDLNLAANTSLTIAGGDGADTVNVNSGGSTTITGALSVTAETVADATPLIVTGAATFDAGAAGSITLDTANNFSSVTVTNTGSLTLNDSGALVLGNVTATGNVSVTVGGDLTDTGLLNITGTTTVTAGAANVVLDDANNFGGAVRIVSAGSATLNDTGAISFSAALSAITTNLTVTAAGAITQAGGGSITVGNATSLTAGAANNITLNEAGNDFNSLTIVSGKDVTIRDSDDIALGASTISGNFSLQAAGAVTDTGVLNIVGTTTLTNTTGSTTLDNANNFGGSVTVTANGQAVALTDTGSIDFAALTSTTLVVIAGGPITDSGTITVTGTASLSSTPTADAANDIILDTAANDFGGALTLVGNDVTIVDGTGGVTVATATTGANFSVTANNAISLTGLIDVSGSLTLNNTTTGGITATGQVLVDGASSLTAVGQAITANVATNDFLGVVTISAGSLSLDDDTALALGVVNVTGNADIDAGGLVDFGGATTITGTLDVDTDANGGTLGSITDSVGPLTVTGITTFDAGATPGLIALDNVLNDFQANVVITNASSVAIDDQNGISFNGITATGNVDIDAAGAINFDNVTSVGGTLDADSNANGGTGGAINDGGAAQFAVTGAATFDAGDQDLIINGDNTPALGAGTNFGSLTFTGKNVTFVEDSSTIIAGASSATGGNFTLTSAAQVSINGTTNTTNNVSVTSNSVNGTIDLNAKMTAGGVVTFTASKDITVDADIDPTTVTLLAANDISISAAIVASTQITVSAGTDGTGSVDLQLGGSLTTNVAGGDINISSGANVGGGNISFTGNVSSIDSLTITSVGTVSQPAGKLTAVGLTLSGNGGAFTLGSATNDFDTISFALTGTGKASVTEADGVSVSGSSVGNPLSVTSTGTITVGGALSTGAAAGGGISLSGAVIVNSPVTVGAGAITLAGSSAATSDLAVNAAINAAGASVSLAAPRNVTIGAAVTTTTSGAITVTADSDATGTGGVQVLAAGLVDALGNVTLSGSDLFGSAAIDAVVIDTGTGAVQVEADGDVTIQDGTGAPATSTTIINGVVQRGGAAAGAILIRATDDVLFGADGDVVQNGAAAATLTITADNGGAASSGAVTMNTDTVINGGAGTITITADDNVTLTGVSTTNSTAAAVTITVATGGVIDAGGATDISADGAGAVVTITAKNGVGVGNAIETTANSLVVSTTNTDIQIAETTGLTDLSLNAGTGNVTLSVGGVVTDADAADDIVGTTATITSSAGAFGTNANKIDTNVTNLNVTAATDVFIDETSGLSSLNISTAGNVTLTAAGSIADTDGAQDITGVTVSVTLSTGSFGATGNNIQTTAGDLTVNTSAGNGSIFVTEADGLTELALNAGTGDVTLAVTAGNVASADAGFTDIIGTNATVTLSGATATFGAAGNAIGTSVASLSVTTNNGDQVITEGSGLTALNLSAGTADITLTTAGSIVDSDGSTDVSADDFNVTAGGAITAATSVNTTTIVTNAAGSVTLTETDTITVTSATVANGSFSLTAGGTITATLITSTADSDANDITLTATVGDVSLGNVSAGAAGDATITAAASITDNNDAGTDLTADDVILTASSGTIGATTNFDMAISNLEGSATGAVTFDNTGALAIGGVSASFSGFTAGGAVTINNTGLLTFSEALTATGQTALITATQIASNGDGDSSSVDIVAASLGLVSSAGIGSLVDAVEINATTLAFTNGPGGDVRIRDIAGGLVIGDVGAIVTSTSSGMAQIVALSPLTVEAGHPISATTGVILTATDSSGSGDDLTINANVTGSVVTLNGGDNITIAAAATLNATAGSVSINADAGTADAGGSVVTVNGAISSTTASTITGGSVSDSISISSTATTPAIGLTINGAGGADTVTIDLNGTLSGTVTVSDAGSSSSETDRVIVIGQTGNTAYSLSNSTPNDGSTQTGGTVVSGGETVAYTQTTESVEVRGTTGGDTFVVQPSQTARITIDGLAGSDTLNVDTLGQAFGVAGNTIVVNGGNPAAFLPISFRSIESILGNSAALTAGPATQKFDFIEQNENTEVFSSTAAGYLPVERDRVFNIQYPRLGTGIVSTYGWTASNINDPVNFPAIADVNDGVLAGTTLSDLLSDGHVIGNSAETFTTQVGNGFYQVTLQVTDVTSFRVRNADTGLTLVSGRNIVGHGVISFVTNVTDGTLNLTFDQVFPGSPDSRPDANYRIDGLELQPATPATFFTGISAATAATPLIADGVTVDAFTVTGAAGLVTVSASLDVDGDGKGDVPLTITTADTDSVLNLTQITGAGGFSIRRPTAAGTGIITLQLPEGGFGVSTVNYTASTTGLLYDFNVSGSANQTGYLPVEPTNTSVANSGFGWTSTPSFYDTSSFPVVTRTDFLRDGAAGTTANTFSTQLTNGTYVVNVTIGTPNGALSGVIVRAEGNTAASGVSVAAGQFTTRQFNVTVADGQLDLEFDSSTSTGWAVAGVEVRSAVNAVTLAAVGALTPDGVTVTAINGSGAGANALITVTSSLGTITSADQSPLYDGIQVLADGAGAFTFNLQASAVLGTPTITAVDVTGNGQFSSTAIATFGAPALRSFDFGTDASPPTPGFITIGSDGLFNASVGYGWVGSRPNSYNRGLATGTTTTSLYQDGAYIQSSVFRVAVASGNYDLRIYHGDQFQFSGGSITAEGATTVTAATLNPATFSSAVTVTGAHDTNGDGYIDITLTGNSVAPALFLSGLQVATTGNLGAASALTAASVGSGASAISAGDLTAIVSAAISRFSDLGVSGAALNHLKSVQFRVEDLGGATIGLGGAGVVVLDDDAAGNGWFVDSTPSDDAEFSTEVSATERRATSGAAAGKYDLLTAVMHELGHELGLDDINPAVDADDLMTGIIGDSTRRLADVDSVFAGNQFWSE